MPTPLTPTNIRSFLCLVGNYMRFVFSFAPISSPFTTLTQKCKKFELSEACSKCFELIEDRLNFSPVLTLQEGTNGFFVHYDAARVVLGCFFTQHVRVIDYAPRWYMSNTMQLMTLS